MAMLNNNCISRDSKTHIITHVNHSMCQQNTPLYSFYKGNVLEVYDRWERPDLIISDGAYGIKGFDGDTDGVSTLQEWYRPHIKQWTMNAKPSTCLWFWNTEIGWATVHPLLDSSGWDYVQAIIWDKGLAQLLFTVDFPQGIFVRFLHENPGQQCAKCDRRKHLCAFCCYEQRSCE